MQSYLRISKPSILLCAFLVVAQFVNGFNVARIGDNSGISNPWYFLAFYWAIGLWFINDSRRHGVKWVDEYLDMGMFLYIACIFIIPYYLFKTRGWKVIFKIALLLGIYIGAYMGGVISYILTSLL